MPTVPGQVTDPDRLSQEAIRVATDAGPVDAHVARPDDGDARPAVIVVHEAFGVVAHTRDVAARFADSGYAAIAPDLYTRVGAPDPDDIDSVFRQMLAVPDERAMADLAACAGWLRDQPWCSGRVGIIGFCSGGRHALLASCDVAVDAAVDCWGGFVTRASPDAEVTDQRPVPPASRLDQVRGPILLVGGAEDDNPTPEQIQSMVSTLQGRVDVESWIADGAGHAFFADYRPSYREAPAFELWDRVQAFFDRHLA